MLKRLVFVLPLILVACGESETNYDPALLEQYRNALPSRDALTAPTPQSSTRAVGDPALYPRASWHLVKGVNDAVGGIVDTLDAVTSFPPTFYDSETKEFVWGPWDLEGELGSVMVYIKENAEEEDNFKFGYAFARGVGTDLSTYVPVIAGGATPSPDNEDHGVGITLWDFDVNAQFLETTFPDEYAADAVPHGRFIALYARGPDDDQPENEGAWVLAYMRDFVGEDEPTNPPGDLDYFYGRYANNIEGHVVDFVNYQGLFDLDEPTDSLEESVDVWMAFFDEGTGRAQASAVGGSLGATGNATAVECWDTSIERTFIQIEGQDGDGAISYTEPVGGTEADCGPYFQYDLATIGLPSLDDIDDELETLMVTVAENGMAAIGD